MEQLHSIVNAVNGVLWGNVMTYMLLGVGLLYTLILKFPQVRGFGHMFKVVFGGRRKATSEGISSFQALCTSLAAQVGTGNIAGVATAVAAGGPGAVFWMWMTALIGMATIHAEAILGQVYRVRDEKGELRGGPAYYIERGLGWRWLGVLFSISIIFAMPFVFNSVQSNSIVSGVTGAWPTLSPSLLGLILVVITAVVIFGGLKRIAHVAELIVPLMAALYLLLALIVVAKNITLMPFVFRTVFEGAFKGVNPVAGGVLGYTVAQAFRYGVARGLFSNEAGMGSTPNANAVADVRHPGRQAYAAMMGVFMDTIVICTCTALIVLLAYDPATELTGVQLTQFALSREIGTWGAKFVAIALIFFAWTSILGNYYYGETNIRNLNNGRTTLFVFRLIVLGFIYFGAVNKVQLIWDMADMFNGIMAFINLFALILLVAVVYKISADYDRRRRMGEEDPYLDREAIEYSFANVRLPKHR